MASGEQLSSYSIFTINASPSMEFQELVNCLHEGLP